MDYKCPYCYFFNKFRCNILNHIKRIHNLNPIFDCTECGEEYKSKSSLIRHKTKCNLENSPTSLEYYSMNTTSKTSSPILVRGQVSYSSLIWSLHHI